MPIKFKTGVAVAEGLKKIFKDKIPKKFWADKGKEFYNKEVKTLLKNTISNCIPQKTKKM